MGKTILAFLAGVVAAISVSAAFFAWHYYSTRAVQINSAVCVLHGEIERLKTQNRQEIATSKRDFKKNLALLGIKNTPALDKAQAAAWAIELKNNAPTPCPFH